MGEFGYALVEGGLMMVLTAKANVDSAMNSLDDGKNHWSPTGTVVWLTGLSSAGKTTIAEATRVELVARGMKVELLDGDVVRRSLSRDLGFAREDRNENVRRLSFVASLLARHGVTVIVAAISPFREGREDARKACDRFLEVYVNAPLHVCEVRDVKGLYRKARRGEIRQFTGIDDPYEPPLHPDVECHTDRETLSASVAKILQALHVLGHS